MENPHINDGSQGCPSIKLNPHKMPISFIITTALPACYIEEATRRLKACSTCKTRSSARLAASQGAHQPPICTYSRNYLRVFLHYKIMQGTSISRTKSWEIFTTLGQGEGRRRKYKGRQDDARYSKRWIRQGVICCTRPGLAEAMCALYVGHSFKYCKIHM